MSPEAKKSTAKKPTTKAKPKAKPVAKKANVKKTVPKKPVKTSKPKMSAEKKKALFSPKIEKITVNIGVGEAGERLKKAEQVIQSITGHKPVETLSKTTSKDWGLRKRMPIGCKVTLRGQDADNFLKEALSTRENKIADYAFDNEGHLAFGIPDHTLFKSQKYDPKIGIFGMDICITMKKDGYRIKRRRLQARKVPRRHRVNKEESVDYFKNTFSVEVV